MFEVLNDDLARLIDWLSYLIGAATAPGLGAFSGLLTFLSILIVSGTVAQLFIRFFKSRFLGFLVASACSIWLYEQVFVRGMPLLVILVSMVLLVALLAVLCLIVFALFVKRIPVIWRIPPRV